MEAYHVITSDELPAVTACLVRSRAVDSAPCGQLDDMARSEAPSRDDNDDDDDDERTDKATRSPSDLED
jgi:hypothetical protein